MSKNSRKKEQEKIEINKAIELSNGATASYWEVSGIVWTAQAAQIILSGWISKEAKLSGKFPLEPQAVLTLSNEEKATIQEGLGDEFPTRKILQKFVSEHKDFKT